MGETRPDLGRSSRKKSNDNKEDEGNEETMAGLTISNGVESIGFAAFEGCKGVNNITIPSSVTNIGGCAFWNCGNNTGGKLTDINYPGTKEQWEAISIGENAFDRGVTIHCTDGDIVISSSQTTPETPQPEESKPAPKEPKKDSGGSSSHSSGGSSQNNKPASAPAPSEPKTEQEAVKETIENLPQGGQAMLETSSIIGSGELRKIMEKGGSMVVFSPQVSWHFNALTNDDMDFNPGIEVGADIPDLVQKLNGHSATPIRFTHNGTLPGTAYVGIAVSYIPGTKLYFYYYNRSTGLFEFQQSATVENGGYVVVSLTHYSDYILTTEPLSGNVANGPVPAVGAANGAVQKNLDSTPHTGS